MPNQPNLGSFYISNNELTELAAITIGNTSVNVLANCTLIQASNSSGVANLTPTGLAIGSASLNSTALIVGANISLDTTDLQIGNTTTNAFANSTLIQVSSASGQANHTATSFAVGNSSVSVVANTTMIQIANSTSSANLTPTQLVIGTSIINSSSISSPSLTFGGTGGLNVGNSTANMVANAIIVSLANSTGVANLTPSGLKVGNTIVNSTIIQMNDASGFANLTPSLLNIGASNVTPSGITIGSSIINTSSVSTFIVYASEISASGSVGAPNQVLQSTGSGIVWANPANVPPPGSNTDIMINDSGVFGFDNLFRYDKVLHQLILGANVQISMNDLKIGDTLNNVKANSVMLQIASPLGTANLVPTSLTIGTSLVNGSVIMVGNSLVQVSANQTALQIVNPAGAMTLTSNTITVKNIIMTGPLSANGGFGTANQVLTSNGTVSYWSTPIVTQVAGGNTEIQFNDSGVFGSNNLLRFDKSISILSVGANHFMSTSAQQIGNTSLYTFSNSSLFQASNTTNTATLTPTSLQIGTTSLNTIALSIGTTFVNSTAITVGPTVINSSAVAIGGVLSNTTSVVLGANVFLTTSSLLIGNSTAQLFANSTQLDVTNAISTITMLPNSLTVGTTVVNTTVLVVGTTSVNSLAIAVGSNSFLNTSSLLIGNSSIKTFVNSSIIQITNGANTVSFSPTSLIVPQVQISGALFANGTLGAAGQLLASDGSKAFWTTPAGGIPQFSSSVAGIVPASGGGTSNYLRADGSWSNPIPGSLATLNTADQVLTGGAAVTVLSLGTVSSGTISIDVGARPIQSLTATGSFTLSPGGNSGSALLDIAISTGSPTITLSGWTKISGDTMSTTNGTKYRCHCSVSTGGSLLVIQAMQ